MFKRMDFHGDVNLGLYGFSTDKYCLLGQTDRKIKMTLKKTLGVRVISSEMLGTSLIGIFSTGNSRGIVVSHILEKEETNPLKESLDVLTLKTRYTAIGNMMVMNDKGIVISPMIKKHKSEIKKFFDLPCELVTVAGSRVIGKTAIATNKGCLLHPSAKKKEMEIIENVLGVAVDEGTVNFGSPFVGAGILANSKGFVAGKLSSGPELGRINDTLGFL